MEKSGNHAAFFLFGPFAGNITLLRFNVTKSKMEKAQIEVYL